MPNSLTKRANGLSQGERDYLDVLVDLITRYEDKRYPLKAYPVARPFTPEEYAEISQLMRNNTGQLVLSPIGIEIYQLPTAPAEPEDEELDEDEDDDEDEECRKGQEAKAKDLKERQVLAAEASLLEHVHSIAKIRPEASRPVTIHFTASCEDDYAKTWTWWLARQLIDLVDHLLSWRCVFVEGDHRTGRGSYICLPASRWSPLVQDSDD